MLDAKVDKNEFKEIIKAMKDENENKRICDLIAL